MPPDATGTYTLWPRITLMAVLNVATPNDVIVVIVNPLVATVNEGVNVAVPLDVVTVSVSPELYACV